MASPSVIKKPSSEAPFYVYLSVLNKAISSVLE